ncbi:MAG: hypothetical protein K9N10_03155 [Deltaproteobacteria bacterium]|nr:hypothetical protein [Deltaproteobacteria bacterium]
MAAMARGAGISSVIEGGVEDIASALEHARQNNGPHIIVTRVGPRQSGPEPYFAVTGLLSRQVHAGMPGVITESRHIDEHSAF